MVLAASDQKRSLRLPLIIGEYIGTERRGTLVSLHT